MLWFGLPYPRQRQQRQEALESFDRAGHRSPFDEMDEVVADLIYEEGTGIEHAPSLSVKLAAREGVSVAIARRLPARCVPIRLTFK
jgi:hypothetical protein